MKAIVVTMIHLLLLSPLGAVNLKDFAQHVDRAAKSRGLKDYHIIPFSGQPPEEFPNALAWISFTAPHQPAYIFVRTEVLERGSPELMKLVAFHEVCHPTLPIGHTEADADECARRMFMSQARWKKAYRERAEW